MILNSINEFAKTYTASKLILFYQAIFIVSYVKLRPKKGHVYSFLVFVAEKIN